MLLKYPLHLIQVIESVLLGRTIAMMRQDSMCGVKTASRAVWITSLLQLQLLMLPQVTPLLLKQKNIGIEYQQTTAMENRHVVK